MLSNNTCKATKCHGSIKSRIESNCVTVIEERYFFNAISSNIKIKITPSQLESSLYVLARKQVDHRLYHYYLIAIDRIRNTKEKKETEPRRRRRRRLSFGMRSKSSKLNNNCRENEEELFVARLNCLEEKQRSGSISVSMFRNRWRSLGLLVHRRDDAPVLNSFLRLSLKI